MRLWKEIQQDMQKQAEQRRQRRAKQVARALLWSAWTTPPAPAGARETAFEWAAQAMLNAQNGTKR